MKPSRPPAIYERKEVNSDTKKERLSLFSQVDLYPVTSEVLSKGRTDFQVLEAVLHAGVKIVQLRDKRSSKRDLFTKAKAFREATSKAGALLIINDHLDIAIGINADGVHLGQEDFPPRVAKSINPDLIIGVSTHSWHEALEAEKNGADYINIGPIFPTGSKEGVEPVGPNLIPKISASISIPFTVMGGISSTNIKIVLDHGARKIAVISAITQAADMVNAVKSLQKAIQASSSVT